MKKLLLVAGIALMASGCYQSKDGVDKLALVNSLAVSELQGDDKSHFVLSDWGKVLPKTHYFEFPVSFRILENTTDGHLLCTIAMRFKKHTFQETLDDGTQKTVIQDHEWVSVNSIPTRVNSSQCKIIQTGPTIRRGEHYFFSIKDPVISDLHIPDLDEKRLYIRGQAVRTGWEILSETFKIKGM